MRTYVNAKRLHTITQVIHQAMVAYDIFFPSGKGPNKPSNRWETPQKGENFHAKTRPKPPSAINKEKMIITESQAPPYAGHHGNGGITSSTLCSALWYHCYNTSNRDMFLLTIFEKGCA